MGDDIDERMVIETKSIVYMEIAASERVEHTFYIAQEEQLEAPQLSQELPPTAEDIPLSSVEKQAKVDKTRSEISWH